MTMVNEGGTACLRVVVGGRKGKTIVECPEVGGGKKPGPSGILLPCLGS